MWNILLVLVGFKKLGLCAFWKLLTSKSVVSFSIIDFTEIPRGKDEKASKDLSGFGAKKTVCDADAKQTGNEKWQTLEKHQIMSSKHFYRQYEEKELC